MSWLKNLRSPSAGQSSASLETTITYMRMDRHSVPAAVKPANINAALLVANKPPLHFYRYLYFHVGIHWNWEARLRLTDRELTKLIHADTCEITTLYVDGAPAGFFEVNRSDPDIVDLAYFGMMPHVHGMGLGEWFLAQAIATCWSSDPGPSAITVNTCTLDHPAALPLYQKHGFKPYRQAKGNVRPLSEMEKVALVMGGTA
ncbi:MAG: GNAT family N-acetyltransferase [Pseudomonadota bacterium]